MQVTRGVARRDHGFPSPETAPALVVTCRRAPAIPSAPDAWAGTAITAPDQRWARCDIKSVALLPNVLAKQAARAAGATEAILVDRDGMVTEGASTTVWMVDQAGVLRTRGLSHAILPGCTRGSLLQQVAAAGLAAEERAFQRHGTAIGAGNLPDQRHLLREARRAAERGSPSATAPSAPSPAACSSYLLATPVADRIQWYDIRSFERNVALQHDSPLIRWLCADGTCVPVLVSPRQSRLSTNNKGQAHA